ncbi:MAG TPA: hypothetical protein VF723_05430 [Pyrinomonadaceae bacterium]|jgi:hypothetical protein
MRNKLALALSLILVLCFAGIVFASVPSHEAPLSSTFNFDGGAPRPVRNSKLAKRAKRKPRKRGRMA